MSKKKKLEKKLSLLQKILAQLLQSRKPPSDLTPLMKGKAQELLKKMTTLGYEVTMYQGFRSKEEQNKLYAQGRTTAGAIVTNARGGESLHNYGVGFDMVFVENGRPSWKEKHPWALLGKEGKKLGLEWGGDWTGFVDRPHFQLLQGYTLQDFQLGKVDYNKYK